MSQAVVLIVALHDRDGLRVRDVQERNPSLVLCLPDHNKEMNIHIAKEGNKLGNLQRRNTGGFQACGEHDIRDGWYNAVGVQRRFEEG